MRRKRPKSEPESTPAALDVAGFDRLEASLNELSKAAATQSLTYLLLWLYLAFTVASVTDYDLLIENPIKLPIFNLEIGLIAFFVAAPPLFWLVQLYMVRKLAVIGEAVGEYLAAAKQQAESAGADSLAVLERLRHRADGFVITRLLVRFDDIVLPDGERGPPSSDLAAALTVLAAGATLIVAPLLLYFGFQIRFLAYQSEFITWWHRGWVLFGLMLCAAAGRTAKLSWGESFAALSILRRHVFRLGGARWLPEWAGLRKWLAAIKPIPLGVFLSIFVLTFPGEFVSDGVIIEHRPLGDWMAPPFVHRTLTPQAVFDREAVAKTLASGEKTGGLDQAGPPPLDLRHRNFSGRSLIGIDLAGAWLQGANLGWAQLQGGQFQEAQLQGANLRNAQLQGANLRDAQLQGANLGWAQLQGGQFQVAQLQGANLRNAQLQGANLEEAQLQGAYLEPAQLQGANLRWSQLQGANLQWSQLQGADLWGSQLQGVNLEGAQLQGANLGGTRLQGANLRWAQLQGANLWAAELQGANLWAAELQGANLSATEWWRVSSINIELDNVYFTYIPDDADSFVYSFLPSKDDFKPDSPEKFRSLAQQWLKYAINKEAFSSLTADGDPDKDAQALSDIRRMLNDHSKISNPQRRADYLADMACRNGYGKWMLSNIIYRSRNFNDVSAAALSDRLKDVERCPAAKGMSRGDWETLARNVEQEKRAASRQ